MIMSILYVQKYGDLVFSGAVRIFKWMLILLVVDVILTIVLKIIILRKTTITVTDYLIPGLISGVGMRLLKMGFGGLFILMNLIVGMLELIPSMRLDGGFAEAISLAEVLVSDLVALIFTDLIGFLGKYIFGFDPIQILDIIFTAILGGIQTYTKLPVLDAYKGLLFTLNQVNTMIEAAVAAVTKPFGLDNIFDLPLELSMMVASFFLGGAAYYAVDTAYAAFKDYGVSSGGETYLKHVGGPKRSDYISTEVVEGQIQYKKKSFVSEEKKSAWKNIWDGITKRLPWTETVTEDVWVVTKTKEVPGEDPIEEGYWETQTKTVEHPEEPYVSSGEKENILTKLKNKVYEFMKGYWDYNEPK